MLQTGEYVTYKEFGVDLIDYLEQNGYTESIKRQEPPKSRVATTPQGIDLCFYGYKSTDAETQRRLKRNSYDCLIQYNKENVTFETICREIIFKCIHSNLNLPINLLKNILFIFLRELCQRPLASIDSIFNEYVIYDNKLISLFKLKKEDGGLLSKEELQIAEQNRIEIINQLDRTGTYSFQEMSYIISYIAVIEELNYPKINLSKYRGRKDCFGRYIEVLLGNESELERLLASNSFSKGASFIQNERYKKYYLDSYIDVDRIELDDREIYY